jgi:hypothetical protein
MLRTSPEDLLGGNDLGSYDSDRNDDFLDNADWMADVPAAPAFEEEGWHSDELDERIDVVIRNPESPLRFVRPHNGLMEGGSLVDGSGLVGGGSLVDGPEPG